MKALLSSLAALAVLCVSPGPARGGCGDNAGDAEAVAAARATIEQTSCPCASATSHGQYVSCVADAANQLASGDNPSLPTYCKGAVKRCAARSTCGKDGFVTCCRSSAAGETRCSTKPEGHCNAPDGGAACTGSFTSCCDACTDSGCAAPPTTTTVP